MKRLLVWLIGPCALFAATSCFEPQLYEEIVATSGGRIQILLVPHDDPSILVEARVLNANGTVIADEVWLGVTKRHYGLGSNRFDLYEAPGGRAGLYRESNSDVLLFAVDFDRGEVFSEIGSSRGAQEERGEILADLSEVAGRPLEFATFPESF